MASRGFLIRFIDIGLIVLFGFLMISDIDASSRVELASSRTEVEEPPQPENEEGLGYVLVVVDADGVFQVSDARADEESVAAADTAALTGELQRRRGLHGDANLQTVVLIQPDPASPVQRTVDVMDVCDRLALAKSLRMDIEIERAPPPDSGGVG